MHFNVISMKIWTEFQSFLKSCVTKSRKFRLKSEIQKIINSSLKNIQETPGIYLQRSLLRRKKIRQREIIEVKFYSCKIHYIFNNIIKSYCAKQQYINLYILYFNFVQATCQIITTFLAVPLPI